jgi:HEAT repeat protein
MDADVKEMFSSLIAEARTPEERLVATWAFRLRDEGESAKAEFRAMDDATYAAFWEAVRVSPGHLHVMGLQTLGQTRDTRAADTLLRHLEEAYVPLPLVSEEEQEEIVAPSTHWYQTARRLFPFVKRYETKVRKEQEEEYQPFLIDAERAVTMNVLACLKDSRAVEPLRRRLTDGNPRLREAAQRALERMGEA